MIKITKTVWQTIIDAVDKPGNFERPGTRKTLRAAIDSALEQITNQLLGPGARSREQMIKGLNQVAKKSEKPDPLVKAALAVLDNYGDLDSFSYDEDEDEDEFQNYVVNTLGPMINLTRYA